MTNVADEDLPPAANDKSFWLKNHRVCCTYNMYGRSDGHAPARAAAARAPAYILSTTIHQIFLFIAWMVLTTNSMIFQQTR